ncbi:MAG: nitronate monooxygenase [Candidatus Desulfatibia sp.]|uniref:NAD(P)H-dependent flavin oxidoreductase n=1 Tax=Candidatus Desulfatibia sp. TaxID=3101189 RepID=UPI002F2E90D2
MIHTKLKIGDLVAKIPIIQGGMSVGISLSGLASAVAEEGGIGVIGTAMIGMSESDLYSNGLEANLRALKKEIRKTREMTQGIIGVNIMVALTNYADMVKLSIEEGIDIIFCGAGLPLDLPKYLTNGSKTKLVPIVSSDRAAKIICRKWLSKFNYLPDALVVEGPKAGGHLGFKMEQINDPDYVLEKIVPQVIDAIKPFEKDHQKDIPVIAAGGIYSGKDIYRFLKMGAAGVQMGTRFVATHECDAAIEFKQAFVDAEEDDLVLIKSPVGLPGRVVRNKFIDDVNLGVRKPFKCPYHCIKTCDYKNSPYCISFALISAKKGKLKHGFAFAGTNAYRIDKIISVKTLITSLLQEYEQASS